MNFEFCIQFCGKLGFPGGIVVKTPPANAEDTERHRFNPWTGKILWRRRCQPTLVFLPGDSMDRGNWWVTIHVVAKSQTWLNDWTHTLWKMVPTYLIGYVHYRFGGNKTQVHGLQSFLLGSKFPQFFPTTHSHFFPDCWTTWPFEVWSLVQDPQTTALYRLLHQSQLCKVKISTTNLYSTSLIIILYLRPNPDRLNSNSDTWRN